MQPTTTLDTPRRGPLVVTARAGQRILQPRALARLAARRAGVTADLDLRLFWAEVATAIWATMAAG